MQCKGFGIELPHSRCTNRALVTIDGKDLCLAHASMYLGFLEWNVIMRRAIQKTASASGDLAALRQIHTDPVGCAYIPVRALYALKGKTEDSREWPKALSHMAVWAYEKHKPLLDPLIVQFTKLLPDKTKVYTITVTREDQQDHAVEP